MAATRDSMTIRSYRACFRLERRIYKLDRWRLPVPWGVPLRGLGYAAAALALVLTVSELPLVGGVIGGLHPVFRLIAIPAFTAYALCAIEPDGRAAHHALLAWVKWQIGPRHIAGMRRQPSPGTVVCLRDVTIAPDEQTDRYRPARIAGPCRVLLRYPGRAAQPWYARKRLVVTQTHASPSTRGSMVTIPQGRELWLR